jgi:hypothetical protein
VSVGRSLVGELNDIVCEWGGKRKVGTFRVKKWLREERTGGEDFYNNV